MERDDHFEADRFSRSTDLARSHVTHLARFDPVQFSRLILMSLSLVMCRLSIVPKSVRLSKSFLVGERVCVLWAMTTLPCVGVLGSMIHFISFVTKSLNVIS